MYFFETIDFTFQSSFKSIAKSSRKCRVPLYLLPSLCMHYLPYYRYPVQAVHLLQLMNLTLTNNYYPKLSMGLGKCIRTCNHHCSLIENSFTTLKIHCAPSTHPSSQQSLIFFQNVTQMQSYSMQPSQIGPFHLVHTVKFLPCPYVA